MAWVGSGWVPNWYYQFFALNNLTYLYKLQIIRPKKILYFNNLVAFLDLSLIRTFFMLIDLKLDHLIESSYDSLRMESDGMDSYRNEIRSNEIRWNKITYPITSSDQNLIKS